MRYRFFIAAAFAGALVCGCLFALSAAVAQETTADSAPVADTAAQDSYADPAVDPMLFYQAKAAAGGKLEGQLIPQARVLLGQELLAVQHAIEYYAADHAGFYPQHINQLLLATPPGELAAVPQGRMPYIEPGFYANPYTAANMAERCALEVPVGWSDMHPGNFSYVQDYDLQGHVVGYTLIGYGGALAEGFDFDGDGALEGIVLTWASSSVPFEQGIVVRLSGGRRIEIKH